MPNENQVETKPLDSQTAVIAPAKKSSAWKIFCAGCGCLILLITLIVGAGGFILIRSFREPQKAAETFLEKLKNKEYESAYELTSTKFKKDNTLEDLTEGAVSLDFSSYKEVKWNSRSIKNNDAVFEGKIIFNYMTFKIKIVLEKVGDWKITEFNLY